MRPQKTTWAHKLLKTATHKLLWTRCIACTQTFKSKTYLACSGQLVLQREILRKSLSKRGTNRTLNTRPTVKANTKRNKNATSGCKVLWICKKTSSATSSETLPLDFHRTGPAFGMKTKSVTAQLKLWKANSGPRSKITTTLRTWKRLRNTISTCWTTLSVWTKGTLTTRLASSASCMTWLSSNIVSICWTR